MNRKLIFDIETFAKNREDVTSHTWNAKLRVLENKYQPFPLKERIICISTLDIKTHELLSFAEEDEQKLLKNFINYISNNYSSAQIIELIGFNSLSFDFTYIITRCLVHNLAIPFSIIKNIDLREIIYPNDKWAKGKLSDFAQELGYNVKTENGEHMREFFINKEWDKIKAHCEEDVAITKILYDRCVSIGLLKE